MIKKFNFYFDYFLTESNKITELKSEDVVPLPNAMPPEFYISLLNKISRETNDFYHNWWMCPMHGGNGMRLQEYFDVNEINFEIKSIHDDIIEDEYNWYVIEITDVRAITVAHPLSNISMDTIKFIKENDLRVLLWLPYQDAFYSGLGFEDNPIIFKDPSVHDIHLEINIFRFFQVYEFLRHHGIKFENFYFRHHTLNYFEVMNNFVDRYPQIKELSKMNIIPTNSCYWLYRFHLYKEEHQSEFRDMLGAKKIKDILEINQKEYLSKKRSKRFLLLNRNLKHWRIYFLAALQEKNILDKGYYSLVGTPDNYNINENGEKVFSDELKQWTVDNIEESVEYSWPREESLYETARDIVKRMPILLDGHNTHTDDHLIPIDYIADSYFSIIPECTFSVGNTGPSCDLYSLLVSEKTYKALYYMHPFILIGLPGLLKYLKSMGFKTFPEFFDESYDEIFDDRERFDFCVNEVEKLCKKDPDEIHELYQSVIPKLIYNRKKLLSFDVKKELEDWFIYEK
jgi:hypothetical protein